VVGCAVWAGERSCVFYSRGIREIVKCVRSGSNKFPMFPPVVVEMLDIWRAILTYQSF